MRCRLTNIFRPIISLRRLHSATEKYVTILGQHYPTDDVTNIPSSIIPKLSRRLHAELNHPLNTLRCLIESHFRDFAHLSDLSPLVSPYKNFDELSFPADHPGRSITDSYYINKDLMLRTHTSAHEIEVFAQRIFRWLLTADVYRRDEIDSTHYPVFHQMEGASAWTTDASGMRDLAKETEELAQRLRQSNTVVEDVPNISPTNPCQPEHDPMQADIVARNLKLSLNNLLLTLFGGTGAGSNGNPLKIRWIETYFPFTSPSFEVEVFFRGQWLEILGCGVMKHATLQQANAADKIGWAFGLGLERIAMVLFSIPDIRLFWSRDKRFLSQFNGNGITTFQPYSKYPPCFKDVAFWTPANETLHENDFCDLVRDVAGDLAEDVQRLDIYRHPMTKRMSLCYRITYRSMDKSLSHEEANKVQAEVVSRLQERFGVEVR